MSEVKSYREIVGEAIGEASMCWSPEGVFDSTRASVLVEKIIAASNRKLVLETLISDHMEAMRPLLKEWSVLNGRSDETAKGERE